MTTTPTIDVAGLTKSYGDHAVLAGVDLSVSSGTIFALLKTWRILSEEGGRYRARAPPPRSARYPVGCGAVSALTIAAG